MGGAAAGTPVRADGRLAGQLIEVGLLIGVEAQCTDPVRSQPAEPPDDRADDDLAAAGCGVQQPPLIQPPLTR